MSLLLAQSFIHVLNSLWVSFDPSHFAEVFRLLEVVEGIVDCRRCARAKLVVQLCERYRRLITRGIVAFNFSPRNLTQVTSAMKPGQECMVWFCFGKENNYSRRVILKIELEFVTVGRDSSFPSPPGAGKGMPWQETGKIKRKEDLGTQVGERPVRRACSVHEGSMLMKSRSRQAREK